MRQFAGNLHLEAGFVFQQSVDLFDNPNELDTCQTNQASTFLSSLFQTITYS